LTDYKILAKTIRQRIQSILSSIIHSGQTGFIKGRFLGQNVWHLNDIMEYTEAKKLPGILLFIDFCKAFDTIEWNFIHKCTNYTTLAQILQNGYPFFIIMLKVV